MTTLYKANFATLLCLVATLALPFSNAMAEEPIRKSNAGVLFSFGIGQGDAIVEPNTDGEFYDGDGLALSLGLAREWALTESFALQARADLVFSFTASITAGFGTSFGGLASVGFVVGDTLQPGGIYLSASIGPGFATLTDQGLDENGEQDCLFCRTQKGGSAGGLSGRLAIGRKSSSGTRAELVLTRTGGNGNNNDYPNGEDAYLQTIMLQFTALSN